MTPRSPSWRWNIGSERSRAKASYSAARASSMPVRHARMIMWTTSPGPRLLPEVDPAVDRQWLDPRELLVGELQVPHGAEAVLELRHARRADQRRRDPRIAQRPRDRHLRQRLPPGGGDLVQRADPLQVLLA